jgi:RHS repeat-associated protein
LQYNALGALHTNFDASSMSTVTFDDQRPKVGGSGTGDAAVPKTLGGQPVTLDNGGRVTGLLGATFTYDWRSRVQKAQYTASNGDAIQDVYDTDAFMRRTHRVHSDTTSGTSPTTTTTTDFYVHDGANLVARIDGSNSVQDAFLFEGVDHPLRVTRSGSNYFYEVDLAGNVRRLRSSSGSDLGGYRYTAFGQTIAPDSVTPAAAIDQPLRWKGRWFDAAAGGVYDVRARWWSPQMGAFLQLDEYAFHRPNSTLWGWPGQNPILFRDPYGEGGDIADPGLWAALATAAEGAGAIVGSVVAEVLPPVLISTVAAVAIAGGEALIDMAFENAQAAQAAQFASDIAATNAASAVFAMAEHTKGARPSTEDKHEKGEARKARDQDREKGDDRRPYKRSNKKKNRQPGVVVPDKNDQDDKDGCN